MFSNKSTTSFLLIITLIGNPITGQSDGTPLTLDHFLEWEKVVIPALSGGLGPQISPDGSKVVYSRRHIDKVNDRWVSNLWIMNIDGSRNRFLTKGSGAKWSPDGTRIAFIRKGEPRGAQIFLRWMDDEGATTQITNGEYGPGGLSWSPDGNSIAFTMMVPSNESWNVELPDRPEGANWTAEAKVVTRLNYRRDYVGYSDEGYRHIFVVSATRGTPRQLTSGDWNHSAPSWTPDGSEILFSSLRIPDAEYEFRESEIYAVDVKSKVIRQLTTRPGPDSNPIVSPDGKMVAYIGHDKTDATYFERKLYIMNLDGSKPKDISGNLDRTPRNPIWAPDNSGVYFYALDTGSENIFFAPVRGNPRSITEGKHVLTLSSISSNGRAVGTLSNANIPGDIVTYRLKRPKLERLTYVNDDILSDIELGNLEELWYESADNYKIHGWVVKPPNFDPSKKYPLMLSIHGGPHGMFSAMSPMMWFEWQHYATNGYVVLYTNPRGSGGYGSQFGNAIKNAYPDRDLLDLMAGVDTVVNRGYIDTKNMFVYGCSGGGVLTAWTVAHTDRFAAASCECPVTNWMSFVGTTDGVGWYRNFKELPWDDPSEHLRRSPLMYVGNVKTPTLLVTGEKDLRTPMGQTEEFYQALRFLKVPTAMVRLQDEWHAYFYRPSNHMRMLAYRRSWFEKYKTE